MKFDFSGYATKNNLKCADGRTIKPNAFKDNDGQTVPLVWQHVHNTPDNVLGHALLENRDDGVYAYCKFNDTQAGKNAKLLVQHGDITALSIFANNLVQKGANVIHGVIREVSLVLSGANPGALIDNLSIAHSDGSYTDSEEEAIIYTGLEITTDEIEHADKNQNESKTVQEVFDSLTEEQKNVVYAMLAEVIEDDIEHSDEDEDDILEHSNNEGGNNMKRNVFDQDLDTEQQETLSHDQIKAIVDDAVRYGSFRDSFLAHAQEYGIENIDFLFPDAKLVTNPPEWVKRDTTWVAGVLGAVKKTPFSRIKTMHADITEDEARAKGYIKGNEKFEEVFPVFKRTTSPTTIYKKQKLDRDDIIDITDLDVVAWMKQEMRMMLDEEIARVILIGDGRQITDPDKINEENIRPIAHDVDLYSHKVKVAPNISGATLIETMIRNRKNYKGSGTPTLYTTNQILIDLLLIKDKIGRRLYNSKAELASALLVKDIVEVEVMEAKPELLGIFVNLNDYTLGADKGGQISMFDDFDIDFNQYKYLMETRISGALTRPKSALVFLRDQGTEVTPTEPTFVDSTGIVTIPSKTGVQYLADDEPVSAGAMDAIEKGATVTITAEPKEGYYFPHNTLATWEFTRPE